MQTDMPNAVKQARQYFTRLQNHLTDQNRQLRVIASVPVSVPCFTIVFKKSVNLRIHRSQPGKVKVFLDVGRFVPVLYNINKAGKTDAAS